MAGDETYATHVTDFREIDLSIFLLFIRSEHGGPRLSGQCSCSALQFLYSRPGAIAPRPLVDGDYSVLLGGDSLVCLAGMDHPSLVHPRRRSL
jgi:hypothetical protein